MWVPGGDDGQCCNRKTHQFGSSPKSTTNFWRLCPWPTAGYNQPHPSKLAPSPTTGARGPRFHHWRRGTTCERSFVRSSQTRQTNSEKAQLVPFHLTHLLHLLLHPHVNPKGRQAYYSLSTTMEAPATWTLVLFQQAIDRQDWTQVEGCFSYCNHGDITAWQQECSHYRTRTRPMTTCLVGHQNPIEATLQERRQAERKLAS